ncbi:MAG: TVP38/TMEM64 family protein [Syntrophales bacterium]|nr:TVP38/TMEM64 family protein [Syntrophales bacterium]
MSKSLILRILIIATIVIIGGWFVYKCELHIILTDRKKLTHFLKSFGAFSVIIFIGLQVLQVIFAPIPGEVTGFIGGYLYGPFLGLIYSTVGLTLGSLLAFFLARWLGLPFVERMVSPSVLKKYDYFIEHQGLLITFILFLIPGFPKDTLCYLLGLSHMKVGSFLLVSTLGRLFGTGMLSISGGLAYQNRYGSLSVLLLVSAFMVFVAYIYRDKIIHKFRKNTQ